MFSIKSLKKKYKTKISPRYRQTFTYLLVSTKLCSLLEMAKPFVDFRLIKL